MLKSNELRLGSIIDFDGMKSVVKEIDNQGVIVFIKETDETEWIDLFQFTPISLTEEILLKCGFEFSHITGDERVFSNKKINLLINAYDNNIIKFNVFIIKHLHQLQNLYFALTNKELEINL